jgi:hypothetical protein
MNGFVGVANTLVVHLMPRQADGHTGLVRGHGGRVKVAVEEAPDGGMDGRGQTPTFGQVEVGTRAWRSALVAEALSTPKRMAMLAGSRRGVLLHITESMR